MFIRYNLYALVAAFDDFGDAAHLEQSAYSVHLNRRNKIVRILDVDRFPDLYQFSPRLRHYIEPDAFVPVTMTLSDVCKDRDTLIPLSTTSSKGLFVVDASTSRSTPLFTKTTLSHLGYSGLVTDLESADIVLMQAHAADICSEVNATTAEHIFRPFSLRISFEFQDWLKVVNHRDNKIHLLH